MHSECGNQRECFLSMKQAWNWHYQSKPVLLIISSVGFYWFGVTLWYYVIMSISF